MHNRPNGECGYSTVELLVVVLVVALLLAALFPLMSTLVSDTRLAHARQDAALIGAAIELLKVEGRYDPLGDDIADIFELVCEKSGMRYEGRISELTLDGCFVYSVSAGGVTYVLRYDAATGIVVEVL